MTRAEKAAFVAEKRAEGWTHAQIADALGIARGYVANLGWDPDGAKSRRHKAKYAVECAGCGATTNPGEPGKKSGYCSRCFSGHVTQKWTREAIVEAIQTWAEQHGRLPAAHEWTVRGTASKGFPSSTACQYVFGSWNAAIEAAGFEPRRTGRPRKVAA